MRCVLIGLALVLAGCRESRQSKELATPVEPVAPIVKAPIEERWLDADKEEPWRGGDWVVLLLSADIGPILGVDQAQIPHLSEKSAFKLYFVVMNKSDRLRQHYDGLNERGTAQIKDDLGNVYNQILEPFGITFKMPGESGATPIAKLNEAVDPRGYAPDMIVCDTPVPQASRFYVTIPAEHFNQTGFVRFSFSRGLIGKRELKRNDKKRSLP